MMISTWKKQQNNNNNNNNTSLLLKFVKACLLLNKRCWQKSFQCLFGHKSNKLQTKKKIMTTISLYKTLFITVSSNELDLDHIKENKSSVISGL